MTEERVITAGRAESSYWADLREYRELLFFLVWRDLLVRYKQTAIGIAWAVLQPVIMVAVFTVVFSRFARMPTGSTPYPVFVLAALLPWQFFSRAFNDSSQSLISNRNLISKVYFPRVLIPSASVLVGAVDFVLSLGILALLMTWYGIRPGPAALSLILLLPAAIIASLGPALWIAALTLRFRDFRYIVPFIVQIGIFISPVGFGTEVVPERWLPLYSLNPVVGVIEAFRWSLLGTSLPPASVIAISSASALTLLVTGARYFHGRERTFADMA